MQYEVISEESKAAVSHKGNGRLELFYRVSSDISRFHPPLTTQHTSVEGKSPANCRRNIDALKSRFSITPFFEDTGAIHH